MAFKLGAEKLCDIREKLYGEIKTSVVRGIAHVRYINILAWLRGFRVKIVNCFNFFCLSIPKRDLDTKKTTLNMEACREASEPCQNSWLLYGIIEVHTIPKNILH